MVNNYGMIIAPKITLIYQQCNVCVSDMYIYVCLCIYIRTCVNMYSKKKKTSLFAVNNMFILPEYTFNTFMTVKKCRNAYRGYEYIEFPNFTVSQTMS